MLRPSLRARLRLEAAVGLPFGQAEDDPRAQEGGGGHAAPAKDRLAFPALLRVEFESRGGKGLAQQGTAPCFRLLAEDQLAAAALGEPRLFLPHPEALKYVEDDLAVREWQPFQVLPQEGRLRAYRRESSRMAMDMPDALRRPNVPCHQGLLSWKELRELRVLIPGPDGQIGTDLIPGVGAIGDEVAGIEVDYYVASRFSAEALPCVPASYAHTRDLHRKERGDFQAVIHLAGLASDLPGEIAPVLTEAIDYCTTGRLPELAPAPGASATRQRFASPAPASPL